MTLIAKKCAIKYDPPTLVVFYEIKDTGKLHRRSIPVRDVKKLLAKEKIVDKLLRESHHAKFLEPFSRKQLEKLVEMLLNPSSRIPVTNIDDGFDENPKFGSKPKISDNDIDFDSANLNKLDDNKLDEIKEQMNESFEQNNVKPDDPNWQYDVEVDFEEPTGHVGRIESGWDDDDEESDMEF